MKGIGFSKQLLYLETILMVLSTWQGFALARLAMETGFTGTLPWVVTMVTAAWGAYGTSAACYYNKAKAENTAGGITYDAALRLDCD